MNSDFDNIPISIIMPTNSLGELFYIAVNSILSQTHRNFELIILTNGPIDSFDLRRFREYMICDPRIKIFNLLLPGVGTSINFGIECSSYDLIARADSDDVYDQCWLSVLVSFMTANNLDLCGCHLNLIDITGRDIGIRKYPTTELDIRNSLLFKNVFAHNTIMIKKSILISVGGYKNGINTEDYDLWIRLLANPCIRCANLDRTLVSYRLHSMGAQRAIYPYSEVTGYFMRDFINTLKFKYFIALIFSIFKRFARAK